MSILIKNGTVVDGTGSTRLMADVLIEGDRIKRIERGIDESQADEVIDAAGLVVAPGFIDTHSHSDLFILENPKVLPKIMQGITTDFLGQDGVSMAPLPKKYIDTWRKNLAGLDGVSDEIDWTYETTDNYLKMIEDVDPGINVAYMIPHGNVRMEAMGLEDRLPNDKEVQKMCDIVRREMEAGAYGLSTGLVYIPCAYSEADEIIEMCKVIAEYDGVFVTHQRSEADTILDSMDEIIEIGRKSGVRVHFSHFKVCGKNNWKYIPDMLRKLDQAKEEGIRISIDQYPYTAGSTMLGVALPAWAHDGGTNKLLERLKDKDQRARMREDILNGIPGWDNFISFAGFDGIYITSVMTEKNEDLLGLNLDEVAKLREKDPFDAMFDLLLEEENGVGMMDFFGLEEHIVQFMRIEEMNVCTDGLMSPGQPHPRLFGAFPRFIGKYGRDEGYFSLENAVKKVTGQAAQNMLLKERGILKEGYYADITIFKYKDIIDNGSFTEPNQYPSGIKYVLVNGQVAIKDGVHTENLSGRVLRKNTV